MSKYANPKLLILDEWLLLKPTEEQQRDIFELISARRKKSSTIFCSQYLKDNWYDQLGGDASALSDGIIDRIFYDSYVVNILPVDKDNDKSMREVGTAIADCQYCFIGFAGSASRISGTEWSYYTATPDPIFTRAVF